MNLRTLQLQLHGRSTTTPISGDACQTADGVPLESTAASEDARVNLFSSTFNAWSESRTDNSRS